MFDTPPASRGASAGRRGAQRARAKIGAVAVCALGAAPFAADALPVIPQSVGFGMDTPAGRGGQVYRVTNLNESGPGSLQGCVAAAGPRVCVFEVSGAIRLTKDLHIWNPYITIAGQTAPSPGIMLRGAALNINTSDVLVQHISIRVGDDPEGPPFVNRDALKIESAKPIKNIVVDHCSFTWALDETVALWDAWDNVTLSNNIIAEALHEKADGKASGYGLLLGQTGGGRATIIGNLLAHNQARNPLNRGYSTVFVNNVVYNSGNQSATFQSMDGVVTRNAIVGNVFIRGADTSDHKPVIVRTGKDEYPLPPSSKLFLADNAALESPPGDDEWSVATSGLPASIKSALPPIWAAGLTRLPTDGNVVLNEVLRFTGARPADRDPVDSRIIKSVRDRTGRILNCVAADKTARCSKNAGGWPVIAKNQRALAVPSDHKTVTPSGYTKLELWLHEMSAQVEGRSTRIPVAPTLASGQ